jgi:hypothetical protein
LVLRKDKEASSKAENHDNIDSNEVCDIIKHLVNNIHHWGSMVIQAQEAQQLVSHENHN